VAFHKETVTHQKRQLFTSKIIVEASEMMSNECKILFHNGEKDDLLFKLV